jgi:hypothetical protein
MVLGEELGMGVRLWELGVWARLVACRFGRQGVKV